MKRSPLRDRGSREEGAGRISSQVIFEGRVVNLSVDRVRFPDGREAELELIDHRGAAAVVPLLGPVGDPDPQMVLVRQYRYPAGGYLLEIPAGVPLPGESWDACAKRELEEETGYRAADLVFLTRLFTTPGFTNEVIHFFLATDLRPGEVSRDPDELMEVEEMPLSDALRMIREGEIRDGKSVASILYLDRFLRTGAP
jgi:ADP-ribose pyrophosphatase